MQLFPFAGLAFRVLKGVAQELTSSSGEARADFKSVGGKESKGEAKTASFEEVLEKTGARNRIEESAGNGDKQRLVVDPKTGRVMLVKADAEGGEAGDGEAGGNGLAVILPPVQKNGEAAKSMLKARIMKGEVGEGGESAGGGPAEDLKKALQALISGGKGEISPDKLKLTKEDFAALKDALKEYGLSKVDIDAIADKVESKTGLTWTAFASMVGQVVGDNLLAGSREISAADAKNLQNFFQKLGFTPQKGAALIEDLKNGKAESVWREVSARVAGMPDSSAFTIEASELKTLAKVMNLSDKARARLTGLLSGADEGRVNKAELRLVIATLAQEAAEQGAGGVKKLESLREVVTKAFGLARDREAALANADAEEDGKARTYKVLASESREAREGGAQAEKTREGEVAARWLRDGGKNAESTDGKHTVVAASKGKDAEGADNKASAVADKDAKGEAAAKSRTEGLAGDGRNQDAKNNASGDAKGDGGRNYSPDDKRAVQEFLSKISREGGEDGAGKSARIDPNAVADKAAQNTAAQNRILETLQQAEQGTARQILRQVQTGMLKAVGQGRQQLSLRLDPPELGKVMLMLQVGNKEVNAVIRAENPDAAKAVAEQLSQLRASLEAQGLKVNKLEVQTQAQQHDQNNWQGAEHNNTAREQGRRAGMSGRWARGRSGPDDLAREMQNAGESARNSREGLYIIA